MSVSADNFGKLAEKIDEARRTIRAAASAGEAELKDKVDQARNSADDLAAELSARAQASAGKGDSHWQQIQRDWERHRQDVRQRIDEAKKVQDLDTAEDRAEWAEADARDAVAHASEAIDEATYAMLDAIQARKEVGALLQASSEASANATSVHSDTIHLQHGAEPFWQQMIRRDSERMSASRIFRLARTSRWAIVASGR